ncbi:hypothetical protein QFC21_004183 [Naganishia friedmannii]|uniref:Uncharacterized protein n=1 Tax=Naganishia friedmannii TaxID=89922 RepID=A0ACC2VL61_9TREE|nr:hypothetical protein QFC21_004183 [Naganishia friedmannii]
MDSPDMPTTASSELDHTSASSPLTELPEQVDSPAASSDGSNGTENLFDWIRFSCVDLEDEIGNATGRKGEDVDELWMDHWIDIEMCEEKVQKERALAQELVGMMREENRALKKEILRIKEENQRLISEKASLSCTLFGNPNLPLEVLSIIGQFLLGNNSYATLSKFSMISRTLRQELQPMLYETVIVSEKNPDWLQGIPRHSPLKTAFRHTKYLIGEKVVRNNAKMFPNLRVVIGKDLPLGGARKAAFRLVILKSVPVATLTTLFKIPVLWWMKVSTNNDGWEMQLVGGIGDVFIGANVCVLGNESDCKWAGTDPLKNASRLDTSFTLAHHDASSDLRQTLLNLFRLILSFCDNPVQNRGYLRKVSNMNFASLKSLNIVNLIIEMLEESPLSSLYPEVSIGMHHRWRVDWNELEGTMVKAADVYSRVFRRRNEDHTGIDFLSSSGAGGPFFTVMQNPPEGRLVMGHLFGSKDHRDDFGLLVLYVDDDGNEEIHRDETFSTSGLGKEESEHHIIHGRRHRAADRDSKSFSKNTGMDTDV